jgi:rhamnulokinase
MALQNYLIFDFGASNGRCSVASYDGSKFDFDIIHRFDNIPVYALDTLYWNFLRLFLELKTGISSAVKKYKDIMSVGIDTWALDFGIIDKNGALISNPIHYRDRHRNSISDEVFNIISAKELQNLTGCAVESYYSIFNLYSLKIQNATEYNCAAKLLMMPDLFNYFLTGVAANEFTDAHTSLMVNPFTAKWENKILDKLEFDKNIFCEIIQPGTFIGNIQNSVCNELNINPIPVIVPATHDTPSAVAGIPIAGNSMNTCLISIGTWGVTIMEIYKPIIDAEVFNTGYANLVGAEGKTLLFKDFTGMWLIQQSRDKWIEESGKNLSWDDIMNLANKTISIRSFINIDAPEFVLPQTDMPTTIKKFCKKTGQKIPDGIGQIARVIYESLVLKVKYNLMSLEKITGKEIDSIHMVGGGTKDNLFCQWISNATGVQVNAGPTETASIGNLLMQLLAAGEIKDLSEGRQIALKSANIKNYIPANPGYWTVLYEEFIKTLCK